MLAGIILWALSPTVPSRVVALILGMAGLAWLVFISHWTHDLHVAWKCVITFGILTAIGISGGRQIRNEWIEEGKLRVPTEERRAHVYLEDVNIEMRTAPEFVLHGLFIANIHGKFRNIGGAQIDRAQVTIIMSKCSDRPTIRAQFKQLFYPSEPPPKGSVCTPNMLPILRNVRPLVPNDYAPFDFEFQAIHLESNETVYVTANAIFSDKYGKRESFSCSYRQQPFILFETRGCPLANGETIDLGANGL